MAYVGVDTSNYTTSVALYEKGIVYQEKKMLPVQDGALGLRQSDAVFFHVKELGQSAARLMKEQKCTVQAFGASAYPRDQKDSYMPCFLVGAMAAEFAASVQQVPLHLFSHQAGHIAAALYGSDRLDLIRERFVALHISGGTTECLLVENLLSGQIQLLCATNDLNAGQVIDRVGNMLGLSFPSGKELDKLAHTSSVKYKIRPTFKNANPCLSGLENQAKDMISKNIPPQDVARYILDYIQAVVQKMAEDALLQTGCKNALFAGGVMSNSGIKAALETKAGYIFSDPQYATDNSAGIAILTAAAMGAI